MHHFHREKLTSLLSAHQNAVIYLRGGQLIRRYGTDFEYPFRQESNFLYLSGVYEPDFHLLLHIRTGEFHLFAPSRDATYAVWAGFIKTTGEYKKEYRCDFVHYDKELLAVLRRMKPDSVFCLDDRQAAPLKKEGFNTDDNLLKDALAWCRIIKSDWELEQLRTASQVAGKAHEAVLGSIEPEMMEYEIRAIFEFITQSNGLVHPPYNGIFASGKSSAVLHYSGNDKVLREGDLLLIDAGAECNGYAADITRTFPVSEQFTDIQHHLYTTVLNAQEKALNAIKPGVKMEDLHMQACRDILGGLAEADLVKGNTDELMEKNIFSLFFPHGLGHMLGLDTHDVGGYPKGVKKVDRPGVKYLRARITLEPGMVLTLEPGLYMIPALLMPAFENSEQARYLNIPGLTELLDFGGIRIEDNVIVTDKGMENMTDVVKVPEEIIRERTG